MLHNKLMKILFLSSILTINSFCQCIGTGCPGGSGGTVSSVFSRTGAVVATGGDYTQGQITPTSAQPATYYCTTASYSDPSYICTTGAGLSTVPVTGTLFVVTFAQACTNVVSNRITIDSLADKSMNYGDGTAVNLATCGAIGQTAILKLVNAGAGVFSIIALTSSNNPVCFLQGGGIYYNKSGAVGCDTAVFISNNALIVNHISGISNTTSTIAAGTGAGTSPTISIGNTSDDMSGKLNITTGTTPATSSVIATITFGKSWSLAPPSCTITPANAITAALLTTTQVFVTTGTSNWAINSNAVALTAATAYSWQYTCIQ